MSKYRVAVLRGGPSDEYDVSMRTGAAVLQAIPSSRYVVKDIIISKGGKWLVDGFSYEPAAALVDIDVVFIALHGVYGEDGTVQRFLERLSVPYTGSRSYPSSVALNKHLTKELLRQHGIKMPRHLKVTQDSKDLSRVAYTLDTLFGPEYVVKPIASGSSVGVSLVTGTTELIYALRSALAERTEVLVEERIRGREATVGILEKFRDKPLYSLPAVEIVPPPQAAYFDYEHKYNGQTDELCPSRFSREVKLALEETALDVHRLMELTQYSRSDFMVKETKAGESPEVYFLEVNTLPGLTEESLFPKALSAVGHSYTDFIDHLLTDAMKRY